MGRAVVFSSGEEGAALEQELWGWPRVRDPTRNPTEGGKRAPSGIAMPPATRRGQHSPRKCQPPQGVEKEPLARGLGFSAMTSLRRAGSPGV